MLPEVKGPTGEVPLKKKLMWTSLALVIFFIMGNITLIGLDVARADYLAGLQTILASNMGTLISAGIGPIVLASIILQLLVGAKFIKVDLSNPADKAKFQSLQKLFAIALCFFESLAYTVTGTPLLALPGWMPLVALQVAFGSIVLLYLDELVSKYGIGSGIGLFIAGGVSGAFFWQIFRPPLSSEPTGGVIMQFVGSLGTGANFLLFLPIVVAIIIFLIVVFAEGMHVNIPITMGRRGMGGRFPVKLLYVSNLPVILAIALFANIQLWATVMESVPILGQIMAGLAWATTSPFNLFYDLILRVGSEGIIQGLGFMAPQLFQAAIYLVVMLVACIVFGIFWVQMGGQSPAAVADQLQSSGMYIPGFRRDKRIIEGILNRYIPTITILGSIFVALLAGLGNMALGGLSSGTGILLTVGIVYRLYEQLAREQMLSMHPMLGKLFK
jgi:preprotein translocase subunit SecY